jgi:glutamate carboxypeptidase
MSAHSSVPVTASDVFDGALMAGALRELTGVESYSSDATGVRRCAETVLRIGEALLGTRGDLLVIDDVPHVRWRFGRPRVAVIGHFDTVWPPGTLERWPFAIEAGRATGPGVYDMKGGVVQALHAVAALQERDGVELLLTGDEEVGSPTSRRYIEELATDIRAALVCEPAMEGRLKTGRKGCSFYRLDVRGRAAHGSQPERGANALRELAEQIRALDALADPQLGTTVSPTTASAGSAQNTVPAAASMTIDVRSTTLAELQRVDAALHSLQPAGEGTQLSLHGEVNRPPMEESVCAELGRRALRLAAVLGVDVPGTCSVPGGSDGNFTAGAGVPTLDGLGAVGDGAHAEGEYVEIATMPGRARLLAALIQELLQDG